MALPFDVNLTINVLREICLSSTIELASLRTNTDGTKYGNLNDASIFGRVYEPQSSSNKVDINSNFPLLANIPIGSPPIKFEEDVLSRTHSHDISLNGSVIGSVSSLENESDESIENTTYNTTKPSLDDSSSTISRSTSIGVQQRQQRVSSNRMHVSKPSIHESIAEVESLISLPTRPESNQLLTPVRPEIGSRSISANTIKSRQVTPNHNQQHLLQPPQMLQANTTTNTTTNSHKKSSSVGSKKQSKGLLALGRLMRPKQLANTLVHHNSTPGSSPYVSDTDSNRSDSLLVRGQQQSNVSGKIMSYSENNLIENLELNHINNQKRIIDSRSIDSDKYLSTNSERDTIDSDFNDQEEDKMINDRYEEVYNDDDDADDDDYDDDVVNNEDRYDNSEVDSIESSDLADSDYDYFNPPAISTDDNALINRLDGLSKVTSLITSDTDYGASPHSRRNKYTYSEYEDPEYIDEMDSDDYISDAEDYTMPDSISYYDEGTGESSMIAPSSIIEVEQDKSERVNSISKISFIKNRPNGRNVSINSANISKSLIGQRRRQSAGSNSVRPHANSLIMSDIVNTSEKIPSTLSASMMHSKNGYSLNRRYKSGKSFSNMRSLALETKEKEKEKDFIIFSKIVLSPQKLGPVSKLTELIHKTNISLDYYKYVSGKQNISDELVNVTICVPKLNIFYDTALKLQINYNVKVVELIGYVLYTVEDKIPKNDNEELKNPNSWKLYLADDDGEIEDDFGVLDRTRDVQSYGADEFVIVECTNEERKINEKITPSPLENGGNINIGNEKFGHNEPILDSIKEFPMIREESINTLPSDLTPTSGINFNNTLPSNNFRQRKPVPQSISSIQERRFVIDALDSDDDDNSTNLNGNNKDSTKNKLIQKNNQNPFFNVGKDIKNYTYLKGKLNSSNIYDKTEKEKESKLNKFKTRSKTIQSILHNTADHYQLTQQELFRTTGNNIEIANNALNNIISSEEIKNKNKNKILGYRLQQNLHNNLVHSGLDEGGDNKALMYHSWTVWRRQQMSFKNKLPKTLTVDGYQIYLLPFNEFKGSWYDSKTYNFDISQILKIKQNIKVPNNFKIIIKKNAEGIVKKYYLEAQSARECKEIVNTIRALAKSYSEQR